MAITEFLLNLEEGADRTIILDPSTNQQVAVKVKDVTSVFSLPNDGLDPLTAGIRIDDEYKRFSIKEDADLYAKKSNLWAALLKPLNYMAELYTKTMACHIGGHSNASGFKIRVVSAMVDGLKGTTYDWEG